MTSQRRNVFVSYLTMAAALALAVAIAAAAAADEAAERAESDRLYQSALSALEARDHAKALSALESYLDFTRSRAHRPERVFWAIDQAGYLYLGVKRDPAGAIAFFGRMRDDERLSELDRGALEEWIAVAEAWKQEVAHASTGIKDAKSLFERGKRFFDSGTKKNESGIPAFAQADFHVADGYLRRFAILHDAHPQIGEALYMLGAIRAHSRPDEGRWSDNFYLKEVIRRFPHTELAERSFDLLRVEATRAYPPKALPAELVESLDRYQRLAHPSDPTA